MRVWRDLLQAREGVSRDDLRRILERASGYDGAELVVHLDERVPDRVVPFFDAMVERRAAGEPLQYVVGRWGFRTLDLLVDGRVLIPRPETEVVVEVALDELGKVEGTGAVLDLGTGSGAIALSLAAEVPGLEVWATERSAPALAVARANLAGIGSFAAARVRLMEGSWFDPLPPWLRGSLRLIVSNPPYVANGELLPSEVVEWEPASALRAGPTGLEDVETIVDAAPGWLTRSGVLVVEIAPHQAADATSLARRAGFDDVDVRPDLAGRPRVLVARAR